MVNIFETNDLDTTEAALSRAYTSLAIHTTERAAFRSASTRLATARLDRVTFGMDANLESAPLDAYVAGRVRSGRQEYRTHDGDVRHGPGDVYLAPLPGTAISARVHELDKDLFSFSPDLLADVADTAPGDRTGVRLLRVTPVSRQAATTWSRTYEAVRAKTVGAHLSPAAARRAERVLALTTLRTFPSTAWFEPTVEDRNDARPETLRRAIAYIESHPDEDVTVADVAAAARVTVRAVQLAFRAHLDMTPMAYHRRVRLAHAHDELVASDGDVSVADVATRWGFYNPGRFSAQHQQLYGELPHQTLGAEPPEPGS